MNIKENSLKRALTAIRLSELPKQFREDSGEYWLEAIILTRKRDGSQSYVAGKRGADGKIVYTADYGTMSPIAGLISVHPFLYLDKKRYMPYDTIEQKRYALAHYIGGDDDARNAVKEMQDCDVEYNILKIAIESQYSCENISKTHDAITKFVKWNQNQKEKHFESKESETKYVTKETNEHSENSVKKSKIGRPRKTTQK